ncbi:hypothetical protein AWB77_01380 [Caballeronia fortuita]|uniref:Uncharacterized protein n=1 Tax=Caballeronia fortuita TaxID=1777138 RepID=A0A158A305_9BURK|nr:hypothetical protein AWB77_01380 [Caballeronia fortuita]
MKADMRLAQDGHFLWIVALTVILDKEAKVATIDDRHENALRLSVLSNVRQRLLQNEKHLQLLIRRQGQASFSAIFKRWNDSRLRAKALDGFVHFT